MVFFPLVRQLRDQGRAIIFISHRMDEIFEIGDRVTILRDDRSVACLQLADTVRDTLVAHMVGGRIAMVSDRRTSLLVNDGPVLKVAALNGHRLTDFAFELQRGEILGFGGLHGQGQSRVLRILFGAETVFTGQIQTATAGRPPTRPVEAIHQGMAYVSGDRGRNGVLLTRPILENLAGIPFVLWVLAATIAAVGLIANLAFSRMLLAVGGQIRVFISADAIARHLGRGRLLPVIKAALLGIPLPL